MSYFGNWLKMFLKKKKLVLGKLLKQTKMYNIKITNATGKYRASHNAACIKDQAVLPLHV